MYSIPSIGHTVFWHTICCVQVQPSAPPPDLVPSNDDTLNEVFRNFEDVLSSHEKGFGDGTSELSPPGRVLSKVDLLRSSPKYADSPVVSSDTGKTHLHFDSGMVYLFWQTRLCYRLELSPEIGLNASTFYKILGLERWFYKLKTENKPSWHYQPISGF